MVLRAVRRAAKDATPMLLIFYSELRFRKIVIIASKMRRGKRGRNSKPSSDLSTNSPPLLSITGYCVQYDKLVFTFSLSAIQIPYYPISVL